MTDEGPAAQPHPDQSTDDDLLGELSSDQRARIEQRIALAEYPAGHLFYAPDDDDDRIYLLRRGRVRIYKLSLEGRALTLLMLEPPSVFGEMALDAHWRHDSFAEAMGECQVGVIRRDTLREALAEHPSVAMRMMRVMTTRLRAMERKLADIAFKSVPQRLATVLISLAAVGPAGHLTVARYTHQQLAEMIGSYRETVTKTIGEFREAGLIRIEGDTVYLVDMPRLQGLVGR